MLLSIAKLSAGDGRRGPVPRGRLRWRAGNHRGFSLVELLVVMAVIAVLLSLLLPTLAHAKRRAKRLACLNNLKQFAAADLMYLGDNQQFPAMDSFVPSSLRIERLAQLAEQLGSPLPPGPVTTWPPRREQPKWINCPMAVESGIAEGMTVGGGLYTGYIYVGGIEQSKMVADGFATITTHGYAADLRNTRRGVLWADILDEFLIPDARRFEFFHFRRNARYPDFRFHESELEGIHRAWSDGSVEWVSGRRLNLTGPGSVDLRIKHVFGNYYF